LKFIIKEAQVKIDGQQTGAQTKDNEVGRLQSALREKELTIEAMLVKMDLFKKNIDEQNFKYLESQRLLDQMRSQDFAKQNLILKR